MSELPKQINLTLRNGSTTASNYVVDANNKLVNKGFADLTYAKKVPTPTNGHILTTDANGDPIDSGKAFNDAGITANDIWDADKIITYVTSKLAGLLDYRGSYDASGNAFPTTGGSGVAGAILKGDIWVISVAGTLGVKDVNISDLIIANVDTPGQTTGNWDVLEGNLGYVPENTTNKTDLVVGNEANSTKYTSTKAVADYVSSQQNLVILKQAIVGTSAAVTNFAVQIPANYFIRELTLKNSVAMNGAVSLRIGTSASPNEVLSVAEIGDLQLYNTYPLHAYINDVTFGVATTIQGEITATSATAGSSEVILYCYKI